MLQLKLHIHAIQVNQEDLTLLLVKRYICNAMKRTKLLAKAKENAEEFKHALLHSTIIKCYSALGVELTSVLFNLITLNAQLL